jgi:hypothetical protein
MAMDAEQQLSRKSEPKPKMYREPPDFQKLHREFEEGLERKRKENKTTQPQEFNFAQKPPPRPKTANQQAAQQLENQKDRSYKKSGEAREVAHSTAKFEQQVEQRRREM